MTDADQVAASTDAELTDRLLVLKNRYDPKRDGGGYPMVPLRELHLIETELRKRQRACACPWCGAAPCESPTSCRRQARSEEEPWVADNHVALDRATDVERYR